MVEVEIPIHSQIWSKRINHPREAYSIGTYYFVKIVRFRSTFLFGNYSLHSEGKSLGTVHLALKVYGERLDEAVEYVRGEDAGVACSCHLAVKGPGVMLRGLCFSRHLQEKL
jgi:hypothetical protein